MAIAELAKEDDKLVCVTADMSRPYALERFAKACPERMINVGIAEENLIGVASGLAKEGFNVFAFTQAAFATTRALDFIKTNLGYMGLPVKLVGLSAGLELAAYGATHVASDDIAQMRGIAGMTVVSPADGLETVKALDAVSKLNSPAYVRLSGGADIVYAQEYEFRLGKAITLKDGADIAIIATGAQLRRCLKAAESLEAGGLSCKVVDMHTIKPLDAAAIDECLGAKLIVTAEEHSAIGGLGGAVAEYLAGKAAKPPQLIIGLPDECLHAGECDALVEQAGLAAEAVYQAILAKNKEISQ
jgi:transketolase